ncbi:MAG: nickel pincer cofactor biosynthesis protein LarB [Thermomicrobium sp.]|nr:nickel pincer cofactor biosynthesis protein LarB [Thermomicrobium sp.]MDW7981755.1 nickel pincer cofactor biosynthesis protein LarB [Thermomicrobium sp.]
MKRPSDPFRSLRAALTGEAVMGRSNPGVWVDPERYGRTGVPEIVLAEGKSDDQLIASVRTLLERRGRVLVSRVDARQREVLASAYPHLETRCAASGRTLVLFQQQSVPESHGGRVGILTAGASDRPAAEEAQLVAEELGCTVRMVQDVGVAGLHRLVPALEELVVQWDADVLIVAAGMDGVLPSVVAGLVEVPVIGLPTPVGYGFGGAGVAALQSMLQTCAPGLVVVNVDNGIGAGAAAAKIARRCAAERRYERSVSIESANR